MIGRAGIGLGIGIFIPGNDISSIGNDISRIGRAGFCLGIGIFIPGNDIFRIGNGISRIGRAGIGLGIGIFILGNNLFILGHKAAIIIILAIKEEKQFSVVVPAFFTMRIARRKWSPHTQAK